MTKCLKTAEISYRVSLVKTRVDFFGRGPKTSSQIAKNWDFSNRSKFLIRKTFGLSKNHKIMFQLSKLDFLEFFIGGVGIKLLDTVYLSQSDQF